MERLTVRRKDGRASIENKMDRNTPLQQAMRIPDVIDRLAAIEDILGDNYDLDRLRELVEADREGRCEVLPFKPGDEVWVVERDEIGEPDCVSGYIFAASACGVVMVHPYIGGCGELDAILHECLESTRENGECDMEVFPIDDCYHSWEAAEQALKERGENG